MWSPRAQNNCGKPSSNYFALVENSFCSSTVRPGKISSTQLFTSKRWYTWKSMNVSIMYCVYLLPIYNKIQSILFILIKLILLYDWCFNNIGVRRGAIGTERVKRHRLLYSRYTMDYRSAASIIRTKQNRIGQKTGIFGHSVPFQKNIELLFNPNESLLYLVCKTPIKSAKNSLLPPIF